MECLCNYTKILLLSIFLSTQAYSQNNQTDGHIIINQVEKFLASGDSLSAMRLYSAINQDKIKIKAHRIYRYSTIMFANKNYPEAKKELVRAVELGLLGGRDFGYGSEKIENKIAGMFGDTTLRRLTVLNDQIFADRKKKYGDIIYELKEIFEKDQLLRREKNYKVAKSYEFNKRLGFPIDSTLNPMEVMATFREFRSKDSLLLSRFVVIVDSIEYVPGAEILFESFPMKPLINHCAHFKFAGFDALLLKSVDLGTVTPEVYAWYKGYYNEYFHGMQEYYFTWTQKLEALSEKEIEAVNRKRLKIGLPVCPATVWDTRVY